jgi:hypothetical protein
MGSITRRSTWTRPVARFAPRGRFIALVAKRTSALTLSAALAGIVSLAVAGSAGSSTPAGGTLSPSVASVAFTGTVSPGTATGGGNPLGDLGEVCFVNGQPNAGVTGCDYFRLDVSVPAGYYGTNRGGVTVKVGGFDGDDIDLAIYKRNPDGSVGAFVTADGETAGIDESATVPRAQGSYYVVMVPFQTTGTRGYTASAVLRTRKVADVNQLNRKAPRGVKNYRASHDRFTSHSEPTIAMDPLDHDHLIAGSKMYENNAKYLFKIGTYESFDGGRTWRDHGHLPGYCQAAGQCDPNREETYRTTSDITMSFDDEGNAYANVLDAPGGTFAFHGFNMTAHIKRPGKPWSGPITVHDNRTTPVTDLLLLDDKNWLAVDNNTNADGGRNRPRDGKVGSIYICWSLDGAQDQRTQQIVLMRSVDGGKTWGGVVPGDNTPRPVSNKSVIAGVGCHVAVGPNGEVYVTWYDNQLDTLFQARSTDRGQTFTPAYPIAGITGVNAPFEGEAFRNLSIPTTAVDRKGNIYVAVSSQEGAGAPVLEGAEELGEALEQGRIKPQQLSEQIRRQIEENSNEEREGGDKEGPGRGADIVMFKSSDGGSSWTGPVRVNQDKINSDADQFQPWIAVTDRGQVNISFFDRRNDPENYYIDTWLARSNNAGKSFRDTRVSQLMWDPSVNPPTSVSGEFIGDYQGLVADDEVAIPFWNDTQGSSRPKSDREYSPWQEVWAARVANVPSRAGARRQCLPRRLRLRRRSLGGVAVSNQRSTVVRRRGLPGKRRRGVWRYCVKSAGRRRVTLVFGKKEKRVRLLVTTAPLHRLGRVGPRTKVRSLRRRLRLKRVRAGLYRVRGRKYSRVLIGTRKGRVSYLAIADRNLLRRRRTLVRYLRRAGVTRKASRKKG